LQIVLRCDNEQNEPVSNKLLIQFMIMAFVSAQLDYSK